jgi:CheY-like chemotaxis protein
MSSNFDNFTANIASQGVTDLAQNSMSHQTSPHFSTDNAQEVQQAEAKRFLREGINAAKNGNRADARMMLLEAAHLDAHNENVWLWLASISEQPAELFEFLQKVLEINPQNARALEWHGQTKNLLVNTEIQRGAALVKENERTEAAECFRRATEYDSTNETAWLWRASVANEIEDKLAFLQRILHLNPNNEKAAASFHATKRQTARNLLKRGSTAAVSGDLTTAREILADVMEYDAGLEEAWMLKAFLSETVVEKAECFIKVLELNPENLQASSGLAALRAMLGAATANETSATATTAETVEEIIEETFDSTALETIREVHSPATESNEDFLEEIAPTEELVGEEEVDAKTSFEEPQAQRFEAEEAAVAPALSAAIDDFPIESQPEASLTNEFPFARLDAPEESFTEENEESSADAPPSFVAEETVEEIREEFVSESSQEFEEQFVGESQQFAEETVWENQETAAETSEPVAEFSAFSQFDPFSDAAHDKAENHEDFQEAEVLEPVELKSDEDFQNDDFQTPTTLHQLEESFVEFSAEEKEEKSFAPETVQMANFQVAKPVEEIAALNEQAEQEFYAQAEAQTAKLKIEQAVSFAGEKPTAEPEFVETCACPFCAAQNPVTTARCSACKAFVSMEETDNLLVHDTLDDGAVRSFIERLHQEQTARELLPQEYVNLGFAYLNLKNFKKGAQHFERAVEIAPQDASLRDKVNRWLEKLHEIAPELLSGMASSGKTIMVVDDSPTVRKLIMSKLEKHGHSVVAAVDGMDALSKINEVNADLILLDVTMPRLDGYQLCKLIRQNAQTKHIPVVMISGKDGFFDKVRGRMAGSTAYITKPFGPETLLQTVETYCK